jgi:hypothetical protein
VRLKKSKCADSTEVSANMRPKFTGLTDRTVIETLLEDEGSALSPDVSAIASPGKESKPHQIPPRTAKPVMLPGRSGLGVGSAGPVLVQVSL